MRKIAILAASAGFAVMGGSAVAADMYAGSSMKDGPVAVPSADFGGLYIGASVGFGVGDTEGKPDLGLDDDDSEKTIGGHSIGSLIENFLSTDYDVQGSVYGAHLGYNLQRGNYVFGIEATINGSEIDGSTTCVLLLKCERELEYYGTVVGKLGYAVDRTMFYALGGFAYGEVKTDVSIAGIKLLEGEETHTGWTAGAGIEHMLNDRFSVRVEYAHVDLGEETVGLKSDFFKGTLKDDVSLEFDTIKIGASLKLGSRHEALESLK